MTDQSIVSQLQSEIVRLEGELSDLDDRKKQLRTEIRTHKRALKLLDGSRRAQGNEQSSLS